MRRRSSGGGIGSFHRLNISPLISQVESEIPIATGEFSFSVNLGSSFFLPLHSLEKILGAMTVCG
jgi:fluoride ion exporter CrcB/FEX